MKKLLLFALVAITASAAAQSIIKVADNIVVSDSGMGLGVGVKF